MLRLLLFVNQLATMSLVIVLISFGVAMQTGEPVAVSLAHWIIDEAGLTPFWTMFGAAFGCVLWIILGSQIRLGNEKSKNQALADRNLFLLEVLKEISKDVKPHYSDLMELKQALVAAARVPLGAQRVTLDRELKYIDALIRDADQDLHVGETTFSRVAEQVQLVEQRGKTVLNARAAHAAMVEALLARVAAVVTTTERYTDAGDLEIVVDDRFEEVTERAQALMTCLTETFGEDGLLQIDHDLAELEAQVVKIETAYQEIKDKDPEDTFNDLVQRIEGAGIDIEESGLEYEFTISELEDSSGNNLGERVAALKTCLKETYGEDGTLAVIKDLDEVTALVEKIEAASGGRDLSRLSKDVDRLIDRLTRRTPIEEDEGEFSVNLNDDYDTPISKRLDNVREAVGDLMSELRKIRVSIEQFEAVVAWPAPRGVRETAI